MPLKRSLSLILLTFYGLGTIIGAGIYALIGNVAHHAQKYTPFSFLMASLVALFTAASYAELSSRFPESAGTALYVRKAFHKKWLSGLVGWLVVLTGLISAAALSHGFVNYFKIFWPVSSYLLIFLLILFLGGITIIGITESALTIMLMTILEVLGLLIIIWYGKNSFSDVVKHWNQYIPPFQYEPWHAIITGAFTAFYAFIGFEDMVNVAEETKHPEKTLPYAIFLALTSATLIYVLVALVTVSTLPLEAIAKSSVPLTLIIKYQGHSPVFFSIIALLSITNGILVQIIMASRLIYGMAKLKNAPNFFAILYEKTSVPLFSTLFIMLSILIFAYWLPIETLARLTSTVMICIFSIMNLSLIIIKIKQPTPETAFSIPFFIPVIAIFLSMAFLILQLRWY